MTPLVFLALIPVGGGVFHPVFTAVAVGLAVLVALLPEGNAALGLVLYLGGLWMLSDPGPSTAGRWPRRSTCRRHLACTLLSYGPPGPRPDAALLALWSRRPVLCLGAAVLVWLVARTVGLPGPAAERRSRRPRRCWCCSAGWPADRPARPRRAGDAD